MEEIDGPDLAPAAFDAHFRAQAGSTLLPELWARAWGEDYPAEVEPFSPCSWSLLSSLVGALRLPPGATLVDLGCGRGGPGLWLARAMNARLVGIDWSSVAVELAAQRAPYWLSEGRYEMRTGTFTETGLPDDARTPSSAWMRSRWRRIPRRRWRKCAGSPHQAAGWPSPRAKTLKANRRTASGRPR